MLIKFIAGTTEAGLVKDLRVTIDELLHIISKENRLESLFVATNDESNAVVGCICLEKCNDNAEIDINGTEVLLGEIE